MVLQNQSALSASEFITYIILYSQILSPAKNIATAITVVQKGLAAGDRVLKIIDTPMEIIDHPNALSIGSFNHDIEYKNISFAHLQSGHF